MARSPDWEHFRTFEAIARLGSVTAAAKALGVAQSTASRHLAELEASARSALFVRASHRSLTERGEALARAVQAMLDAAVAAEFVLEDTPVLQGEVTLATVGELVRWILVDELPSFYARYPELRLRILADNRTSSLAAGEADVALRLTRPSRGELVARRRHVATYGYYAGRDAKLTHDVPWLGLTGSLAAIPEQRHAERVFGRPPRLLVEDVDALGRAVSQCLGVAVLPRALAARLDGVVEVAAADVGADDRVALPTRGFWVVVHRARQRLPKVRALLSWLDDVRFDAPERGLAEQRRRRR
jgi:DNA-binding transcriptional LysR family regulator